MVDGEFDLLKSLGGGSTLKFLAGISLKSTLLKPRSPGL